MVYMKRKAACIILSLAMILLSACGTKSSPANHTTTKAGQTMENKAILGVIEVKGGEMLERDIIPQLSKVFSLSEQEVKDKLAASGSSMLISSKTTGFRRMEGMIPPGKYEIAKGSTLEENLALWIAAAEKRYSTLRQSSTKPNDLDPAEQLALASMVEAECLGGTHNEEVATVFLNRLEDGSKLQSCVTAEYALGYQRPFLTAEDISVESDYNTYYVKGLPAGPICSVSDASLKAAMGQGNGSDIYYFYYDYVLNNMFFFSDYSKFQEGCKVSSQRFEESSKVGRHDKINKQALY
jgi:cell division protein YceG involved in septum cleavage